MALRTQRVEAPDDAVDALLSRHFADMRAGSPEESCHVMTADDLRHAGASVFALHQGDALCAVGAFKPLSPKAAPDGLQAPVVELKSMHVARACRGLGLGRVLLRHLIDVARDAGARGACLETGTQPGFDAARGLYLAEGFHLCAPFGTYREDPLSVYMSRAL